MGPLRAHVDHGPHLLINEAGCLLTVWLGEPLVLLGWVVVRHLTYFFIHSIGNYLKFYKQSAIK